MTRDSQANRPNSIAKELPVVVTQEAFWSRVDKRGPDECWTWRGGRGSTSNRYGRFRNRPAHQVAWELENGCAFPAGKNGCHSCDNPSCVNPAHIWPGTQADNLRDCVRKGRHGAKPHSHCKQGHELTSENRILMPGGGSRCRACERVNVRARMARYRLKKRGACHG